MREVTALELKTLDVVTANDVGELFNLSPRTIRKYAKSGRIPHAMVMMSKKTEGKVLQYYWLAKDIKKISFHKQGFTSGS